MLKNEEIEQKFKAIEDVFTLKWRDGYHYQITIVSDIF